MPAWEWDQGHTPFFQFEAIKGMARGLEQLQGVTLTSQPDPLRAVLMRETGLTFAAPPTHSVWRQYKRVMRLTFLATDVNHRLVCTDVCHALATGEIETAEDYFAILLTRTRFPSPAFQSYTRSTQAVYPMVAILKFALARAQAHGANAVTVSDVFSFLVGNGVTGLEDIAHYSTLVPTGATGVGDEVRQIREMMRVMGQLSFFKWSTPNLRLDVDARDPDIVRDLLRLATPSGTQPEHDRATETLNLGRIAGSLPRPLAITPSVGSDEEESFVEGNKSARFHLRTERSRILRAAFFAQRQGDWLCDICQLNPPAAYPWVGNILELHHLLPLSSSVRVEAQRTRLGDMVPVCPSCHRATHAYYRDWLRTTTRKDFADAAEAVTVYQAAKATYIPQ